MKKVLTLVLAVALLALAVAYAPVRAETVDECQALIAQTSGDLAGVTIGGNNPDRTRASLESKLDGASTKLDEGKYEDALAKLVQFRTAVEQLRDAAKPKISAEDAALLIADAGSAIACVQNLISGG